MAARRVARRKVLGASFGVAVAAQAGTAARAAKAPRAIDGGGEIYECRTYHLRIGAQARLLGDFLAEAFIPTLNRLGVAKVGVWSTLFGPGIPGLQVLVPHASLAAYARVHAELLPALSALKSPAARAYLDAPAAAPAYDRLETQLLRAMPALPKLEPPASGARVFELRTYESPGELTLQKKMSMFNPELGELGIFRRVGLQPVFFGQALTGARLPSFTYALVFPDLAARQAAWDRFRADEAWLKLRATPGYADAEIMNNITSLMLTPTPYSQI